MITIGMKRNKLITYILFILIALLLLVTFVLRFGALSSLVMNNDQSVIKVYSINRDEHIISQYKHKFQESELNAMHSKLNEDRWMFVKNKKRNTKHFHTKSSNAMSSSKLERNQCKKNYKWFLFTRNTTIFTAEDIINITNSCENKPLTKSYKIYGQTFAFGLGNQMFFYASAKSIALKSNRTFIHRWRDKLDETFNLPHMSKGVNINKATILSVTVASCCTFFEAVYYLPEEDIRLDGYLQSWRYLNKTLVKHEFKFKKTTLTQSSAFIQQLKILNQIDVDTKLIGIHVRRGDMLSERNSRFGHTVASRDYIIRAMRYYENKYKCHFIVASNDINWCKENLLDYENKISYSENNLPAVDMSIISQCDHLIITVGTFGWWAAYLSNGEVVYCKDWPKKGSAFDHTVNKDDYFPPHWLPL